MADRKVEIYTTRYCGYCRAALALLKARGVDFEQIDVSGDNRLRQWLRGETGQHTVPQIFWNGRSVGGYTELVAQIDQLLQEA